MGIITGVRKLVNPVGRFRKWTGVDPSLSFGQTVVDTLKGLFTIRPRTEEGENFKQVVSDLNLNEQSLLRKQRALFRLAIGSGIACILMLCYVIYLLLHRYHHGVFVGLGISCILAALFFRYHFWYFQIKNRRLGCTFRDWFQHGILGRKDHES